MKIRFSDEFEIEPPVNGSVCWTLEHRPKVTLERGGAKIGDRVKHARLTYHTTIGAALSKAIDLGLRKSASVQDLINGIDISRNMIQEFERKFKKEIDRMETP